MRVDQLRETIREVPDFPKPGINFYDLSTLFRDAVALKTAVDALAKPYRGQEIDRFAVNVNPDECELQSMDPDQFATALGASTFDVIASDSEMGRAIAGFRIGRELWHIFLWIALALLAVEMILGRGAKTAE